MYSKINSGSCETHSMTHVQDISECELAAKLLGQKDIIAHDIGTIGNLQGRPFGCIYASNDWLGWYSPDGSPSPSDCGTQHGNEIYACICRLYNFKGKHNFLITYDDLQSGVITHR